MKFTNPTFDAGRRRFCKIAALAVGAAALPAVAHAAVGLADDDIPSGGCCRLRVVRCNCFEDLQSLWLDDPEAGPCGLYSPGEEIEVDASTVRAFDAGKDADGFRLCPAAWRALRPAVIAAMKQNAPERCLATSSGAVLTSCPSGSSPVSFLISPA